MAPQSWRFSEGFENYPPYLATMVGSLIAAERAWARLVALLEVGREAGGRGVEPKANRRPGCGSVSIGGPE
jgi:hypothetical protein